MADFSLRRPQASHVVLLDIEGTTTPIAFVHDVSFRTRRRACARFSSRRADTDPEIRHIVDGLREEHARDPARGESPPPWPDGSREATRDADGASAYVYWLMDRDRKSGPLKALQGRIWEEGYATGALKGEVYPDVPAALRRWTGEGLRVGIFSSGSVLAQQLLFAHSTAGDLSPFLTCYFDTAVGPKRDPDSYRRIAAQIAARTRTASSFSPTREEELSAARTAGLVDQAGGAGSGDYLRRNWLAPSTEESDLNQTLCPNLAQWDCATQNGGQYLGILAGAARRGVRNGVKSLRNE